MTSTLRYNGTPNYSFLLDTLKLTNDCGQQLIVFPSSLLLDLHVGI